MADSIFPVFSIERGIIRWEDYLYELTPFEQHDGVWFKREDKFAPLGYGGINGSKLRQCIYLLHKYWSESEHAVGILSGASVKSPQLSMSTAVAKHYNDMDSIQVIGATKPETALTHENVAIAARLGARFVINPVAYNPGLQKKVKDLQKQFPDYFKLEYGISIDGSRDEDVEAFHRIGAEQVLNFPPEVETLIIPTGSANSAISIIYGLALYPQPNLKTIYLMLIGPNKTTFMEERLQAISNVKGGLDMYNQYLFKGFDLHGTNYTKYADEMPESNSGIEFHPTYEGKVMRYLKEKQPDLLNDKTCVWVVGSKPRWEHMAESLPEPAPGFVLL